MDRAGPEVLDQVDVRRERLGTVARVTIDYSYEQTFHSDGHTAAPLHVR